MKLVALVFSSATQKLNYFVVVLCGASIVHIDDTAHLVPLGNEQPASARCQNERNKVTRSKALRKQQSLSQSPSTNYYTAHLWVVLERLTPRGLKFQRLLST